MFFNGASFGLGFLAGFGAGFVAREIFSTAKAVIGPVSRRMVAATTEVAKRSRETVAEVGESFEDLVAEVRAELANRNDRGAAPRNTAKTGATVQAEAQA